MRKQVAVAVMGAALFAGPTAVHADKTKEPDQTRLTRVEPAVSFEDRAAHERRYVEVRERFADEFGVNAAGRDLVRDGVEQSDGDVLEADASQVTASTERMETALNPPEPAPVASSGESVEATETTESYDTSGAPTEVIECESGGDYGAVNPAGYYGAYQFDQSTWDAYAPEGYAGTLPSEAPPEVQDAAAAAVPYDAWPNCP